jgi:hypothetical protein
MFYASATPSNLFQVQMKKTSIFYLLQLSISFSSSDKCRQQCDPSIKSAIMAVLALAPWAGMQLIVSILFVATPVCGLQLVHEASFSLAKFGVGGNQPI